MVKMSFSEWSLEIWGKELSSETVHDYVDFLEKKAHDLLKAYDVYCGQSII